MAMTTTALALVLALVAAAAASRGPNVATNEGHVYITTGDVEQNVTDLLSKEQARPLFKDQEDKLESGLRQLNETLGPRLQTVTGKVEQVERRSTKNVADLLDGLATTGKTTNEQLAAIVKLIAKGQADTLAAAKEQTGAGTPTKTAGAAFNPFTASVGALGGEKLRVTFPKGAELIANPNVKMYQCKFTYLKDKKLDASKARVSEPTFADTERTFACAVPAWGEKGKMPEEAYFTTNLQVLENGRLMPEPTGGQIIKWTPQKPSLKFGSMPNQLAGPSGKAKVYSVDLSVLYGYGEAGYKDVQFTAATDKPWANIINKFQFSGSASSPERKLGFSITHPKDAKKEFEYWIDVTITSAKYKLSTKHRLSFKFKVQAGWGPGGKEGMVSETAVEFIKKHIQSKQGNKGINDYELCYSHKLHGWNPRTLHTKCDGRGPYMFVMRRADNKRVFGGYYKASLSTNGGYSRGNSQSMAFMWRIDPNNANKVDILKKHWHNYYTYQSVSHFTTFGGGHDWYCSPNGGCHSNAEHSYDTPYGYGSTAAQSYLAGSYSWNGRAADYEVYIVK